MQEGFFSSAQIKSFAKRKYLPPRMKMDFAPTVGATLPPLHDFANSNQMIMDIECYWNYFLVKFLRLSDDAVFEYERTYDQDLNYGAIRNILRKYEIITFNGIKFDIPLLRWALEGATNKELKEATNSLIQDEYPTFNFEELHDLPKLKIKHIDLIELLPGIVSLKIYGGRFHAKKLQDLPYPEDKMLTDDEMDKVCEYCGNDLRLTKLVFSNLLEQVKLRRVMSETYGLNLLSKSDAQIAEEVIKSEVSKLKGGEKLKRADIVKGGFCYRIPEFIRFINPKLNDALDMLETKEFMVGSNGRIKMPEELSKLKITIGVSTYKLGMGGLHSTEKCAYHVSDKEHSFYDFDVDSYYPRIILLLALYPKKMGKEFLRIYKSIVIERLEAKRSGDKVKADSLKICVNGSFGKLGSPYSTLYAPELMVQVTVTGQLSLLMLIDVLENRGFSVVSGNTDGIVIKCPTAKEEQMRSIIKRWEATTGFTMSGTKYAGLYSRDINNYIAVKEDGKVKTKGIFAVPGMAKNPENEICNIAMINYLKFGTDIEATIKECRDITKFVTLRQANGGALKHCGIGEVPFHRTKEELCRMAGLVPYYGDTWIKENTPEPAMGAMELDSAYRYADDKLRKYKQSIYLGKAIRWYHAKGETTGIVYKNDGRQVGGSEGAKPLMDLPDKFPTDVDYDYYISKTKDLFY